MSLFSPEEFAFVYHHWGAIGCNSPHSPTILSIASLRARNPRVPIYVLDGSPGGTDWHDFAKSLAFTVVPIRVSLRPKPFRGRVFWEMCSKTFDVWRFARRGLASRYVVFSDTDVFWLKDPLPLAGEAHLDRLCCRPENTGLYYFDRESAKVAAQFELWERATLRAIEEAAYRREVWSACGIARARGAVLHDEMVYSAVRSPTLTFAIPMSENRRLKPGVTAEELSAAKNLHLMRVFWGRRKREAAWAIAELRHAFESTLGPGGLRTLFGDSLPASRAMPLAELGTEDGFRAFSHAVARSTLADRCRPSAFRRATARIQRQCAKSLPALAFRVST